MSSVYVIFEEATGEIIARAEVSDGAMPPEGALGDGTAVHWGDGEPGRDRVDLTLSPTGEVRPRPPAELDIEVAEQAKRAVRQERFRQLFKNVDPVSGVRWDVMPVAERAERRALRRELLDMPSTGAPMPVLPAVPPLDAAKRKAVERMMEALAAAEEAIIGDVPRSEMIAWIRKEEASRALRADGGSTATPAQVALLTAEASIVGETIEDLADTIIANADAYVLASAQLTGVRRVVQAGIDDATTEPEIEAALAPLATL